MCEQNNTCFTAIPAAAAAGGALVSKINDPDLVVDTNQCARIIMDIATKLEESEEMKLVVRKYVFALEEAITAYEPIEVYPKRFNPPTPLLDEWREENGVGMLMDAVTPEDEPEFLRE